MSQIAIRVDQLSKEYAIGGPDKGYRTFREAVVSGMTGPFRRFRRLGGLVSEEERFWALKDVSFEVGTGEVVGIIGRNGAGKSTLLKILSRITQPTRGRVEIRGRVASLLEVGTGFHPELTGRENIYLNGAILGMRRREIDRKFDEIVAFAEVERFLDTPVKHYSSGMYVRLAFAVAAHLEPEILIVDEILAVGDAAFQKKCLGRMGDVAREGRTVLFVSHSMGTVNALTQKCALLEQGRIAALGESRAVVAGYLSSLTDTTSNRSGALDALRRPVKNDSPLRIVGIAIKGAEQNPNVLPAINIGAAFTIELDLEVSRVLIDANVTMILKNCRGECVTVFVSWDRDFLLSLPPGRNTVKATVSGLPLSPGNYFLDVGIDPSMSAPAYDAIIGFPVLSVVNDGRISHWLDRPWGAVHWDSVEWRVFPAG